MIVMSKVSKYTTHNLHSKVFPFHNKHRLLPPLLPIFPSMEGRGTPGALQHEFGAAQEPHAVVQCKGLVLELEQGTAAGA
jgi:hypothetical protein